jgi:hypothetical protein
MLSHGPFGFWQVGNEQLACEARNHATADGIVPIRRVQVDVAVRASGLDISTDVDKGHSRDPLPRRCELNGALPNPDGALRVQQGRGSGGLQLGCDQAARVKAQLQIVRGDQPDICLGIEYADQALRDVRACRDDAAGRHLAIQRN